MKNYFIRVYRWFRTLVKAYSLRADHFKYDEYITDEDCEHKCATVACIVGWYPLWFPKSGAKWDLRGKGVNGGLTVALSMNNAIGGSIIGELSKYHLVSRALIYIAFYGHSDCLKNITKLERSLVKLFGYKLNPSMISETTFFLHWHQDYLSKITIRQVRKVFLFLFILILLGRK